MAYSLAMRAALAGAGFDDLPGNGVYVVGALARRKGSRPLSELIEELRLSKQAAGQLVDTLVTRGYLDREVNSEDRRRLTVALTRRGIAAARVLGTARAAVDAELMARAAPGDVTRSRRVLSILIEISHELDATNDSP